jgi:hypothetical protein
MKTLLSLVLLSLLILGAVIAINFLGEPAVAAYSPDAQTGTDETLEAFAALQPIEIGRAHV